MDNWQINLAYPKRFRHRIFKVLRYITDHTDGELSCSLSETDDTVPCTQFDRFIWREGTCSLYRLVYMTTHNGWASESRYNGWSCTHKYALTMVAFLRLQ